MPSTLQSPARSPRHSCVDQIKVIHCTAMDVAIAGDFCALHLHSNSGTTKVILPTSRFVEAARGPRDCNRRPFPVFLDRAEKEAHVLPPPPELMPALPPASAPRAPYKFSPEVSARIAANQERYLRAYADLQADRRQSWREVAERHGMKVSTLQVWCSENRAKCAAYLAAQPVLKPGGKLL